MAKTDATKRHNRHPELVRKFDADIVRAYGGYGRYGFFIRIRERKFKMKPSLNGLDQKLWRCKVDRRVLAFFVGQVVAVALALSSAANPTAAQGTVITRSWPVSARTH